CTGGAAACRCPRGETGDGAAPAAVRERLVDDARCDDKDGPREPRGVVPDTLAPEADAVAANVGAVAAAAAAAAVVAVGAAAAAAAAHSRLRRPRRPLAPALASVSSPAPTPTPTRPPRHRPLEAAAARPRAASRQARMCARSARWRTARATDLEPSRR